MLRAIEPISKHKILPFAAPVDKVTLPVVQFAACRGEFEPFSVVLQAEAAIGKLAVKLDDFRHQTTDALIQASAVDIKLVKAWYQAPGAWRSHILDKQKNQPVLVPELLLNDDALLKVDYAEQQNYLRLGQGSRARYVALNKRSAKRGPDIKTVTEFPVQDAATLQPFHLAAGEQKQLWLTLQVPQAAVSGHYQSELVIESDGIAIAKITVLLQVYPFELDEPLLEYSLYYRGKLVEGAGSISSEKKSRQQLQAELKNMLEHGIRTPTLYQKPVPLHLFKEHLAIRQAVGIDNQSLYYLGRTTGNARKPQQLSKLQSEIGALARIAKQYGVHDFYLYGFDEAKKAHLLSQRPAWQALQAVGIKVLAAGYKGHYELMGDLTDLLIYHSRPEAKEAAKFHSRGKRIFSYNNPQVAVENPLVYRRNYGFKLWQADFDGAMNYAYQASMAFIWNDFDHAVYRDHVFTYPTRDGVIDTIAWEGFREGVDDVRYLSTLLEYYSALKQDKEHHQLAQEIAAFIAALKQDRLADPGAARKSIADKIIRIQQIANYKNG